MKGEHYYRISRGQHAYFLRRAKILKGHLTRTNGDVIELLNSDCGPDVIPQCIVIRYKDIIYTEYPWCDCRGTSLSWFEYPVTSRASFKAI